MISEDHANWRFNAGIPLLVVSTISTATRLQSREIVLPRDEFLMRCKCRKLQDTLFLRRVNTEQHNYNGWVRK